MKGIPMKERIVSVWHDLKKYFSNKNNVLSFLKDAVRFVPTVIILTAYLTILFTTKKINDDYILIMTAITLIAVFVPFIKLYNLKIPKKLISCLLVIFVPLFTFYIVEAYMHNSFGGAPAKEHIVNLNIAFYYLIEILLITVTTRTDIAIIVTMGLPSVLGIANYISLQTRDLPIYPWDVFSAGTAISVVDNYQIYFSPVFKLCTFSVIAIILIAVPLNLRFKFKKLWIGIFPAVAAIMMFCGYVDHINTIFKTEENAAKEGFYPYLYSAGYLYKHNGTPVTFIYTLKYLNLSPPEGYDVNDLEQLYLEYKQRSEQDALSKLNNKKPNIIVIINEAFSDPSVLGDFETNIDYFPFINSLRGLPNVRMGSTLVSVKGGNTPNSEFEFLTGTSMAFLPAESIPYQQFINGNTLSIVSQLNSLGYKTVGMHNYYKSGWERDQVYDHFGFDQKYFLEDMRPLYSSDIIRSYMSDSAMYKRIMSLQENKSDDEPLFVFGVTMQNHGGYSNGSNKGFVPEVSCIFDKNYAYTSYLNNYLSLLRESDKAFEELVNYYSSIDEPTVIIMFGDHQPSDHVVAPILNANGISIGNSVNERQLRYQTPYIMWANYDFDNSVQMPEQTSLNYLGGLLMDACGIPLTPFQLWQKDLMLSHPLLNAFCYTDSNGNFSSISGIKRIPMLNKLAQIQYNMIFDTKHLVTDLFEVQIP